MPITQCRMLALVAQAVAIRDAHARLRETLRREALVIERDPQWTAATAMQWLRELLDANPPPPHDLITVEAYHFRKFARANDRRREKMRLRRLTSRKPQDTTTTTTHVPHARANAAASDPLLLDEAAALRDDDTAHADADADELFGGSAHRSE